ncbi:UDP-N-acetylmuramate dehydrogenase [Candidatus Parcubacteria bacterium]|jgi:UDP-N-acetylmuramate dehydrogenase|nr:UDP-N-acetylmuramate dehydrogenase [Candidatus Parcubacteria bacterium]MBT3948598.1 UDP-N-acetylmuramate dehydrogenase [Candidatus Parcubacteria bacterium]
MDQLYKELKNFGKVKLKESLAKHTTFKIGGPAKYFVIVEDVAKLSELLKYLDAQGIPYVVIGGGSNMLVSDDGFDGVIIRIKGGGVKVKSDVIEAGAGCTTVQVAQESIKAGLTGFEWGVGVPGTIGGAVRGNAGAMGGDMNKVIEKVEVYQDGEVVEYSNEESSFKYRDSIFKHNGGIILRVWLKLEKGENRDLQKQAITNIQYRNQTQPHGHASSGCTFKNVEIREDSNFKIKIPQDFLEKGIISAGWLIDQCNIKGYTAGNAQVSEKHGNFIVNLGGATANDVLSIIDHVKGEVYNTFGINLQEEIQII